MRALHGWLPAVVPATVTRFRIEDEKLAATLVDAGAELVESDPEVEIARSGADLRGGAELAIVTVVGPESRAGPRWLRAARRAAQSLRAWLEARRARRALIEKGYTDVDVLYWDLLDRVRLPRLTDRGPKLPRSALALGRRGPHRPSAIETALDASGSTRPDWASTRAGLVVLGVDRSLLRVAIGPTRAEIDHGIAALESLRALSPPPEVADRVPWPLERGRIGLADWSLERLLPGSRPPRDVPEPLFSDCLEFLVALGRLRDHATGPSLGDRVMTIESVCAPESVPVLRTLAERLEKRLADVPRCFAHGDFFVGNLLEDEGGRLSGVVDWDAAGTARLPLLDLLHLSLTRSGAFADKDWGRALLDRLIPLVRAGGSEEIRHYCAEIGLQPRPELLEALVFAYWLDYVAYQLRAHPVRRAHPAWIQGNVELVLRSAADMSAE